MSADAPRFPAKVEGGSKALEERLHKEGLKFERTAGMYDGPETSYIIHNPSREQMLKLGSDFGQESVIWGAGHGHEFHYTAGPNAGMFVQGHPVQGVSYYPHRPSNFWTAMPNDTGFFRLNFDPEWKLRPGHELKAESIVKKETAEVFEVLEKRSKNVREKTRRIGSITAHNRMDSYLKRNLGVEIVDYVARSFMGVSPTPKGLHVKAGVQGFPPEHEMGHALMAPPGQSITQHMKDIGPPPGTPNPPESLTPEQERAGEVEENAATTVQMGLYRRAGVRVPDSEAQNRKLSANPSWREPKPEFGEGVAAGQAKLAALDSGAHKLNPTTGVMETGAPSLDARINARTGGHPHAYDWHDGHTDHHTGLLKADEHPHTSSFPKNDQAAGVGVSTYAKYAEPYGHVTPGVQTNLLHYPLHGLADHAKQLVQSHGYQSYYAGGKYGKPDLARRNYNTKHLMVYDPSPDSGASFNDQGYTDAWRHVHELAHALTYPELNQIYGEGRRIGKLGVHRNVREAARAVHWEWLAAHKQRELSAQMGVHIPDDAFNKEVNTVMHDAVHRAVTGKFTEPSGEGFLPHAHKVPLETALGMIQEAGRNLGLQGPDDLLQRKSENMNPTNPLAALRKAVLERLKKTEADLIELAEREATATKLKAPPADPIEAKVTVRLSKMDEHTRQGLANRMGYTHRWFRDLKKSESDEIGDAESHDYRSARDAALKKAFIEGEQAQYKTLHKGLGDQHMEPGVHENAAPGAAPHAEPGGHEMASMPTVDAAPTNPVGSSAGIPSGELAAPAISQPAPMSADPAGDPTQTGPGQNAELCPMCGNMDVPGQCTCLPGQDQMAAPPAAEQQLAMNEQMGYPPAPMGKAEADPKSREAIWGARDAKEKQAAKDKQTNEAHSKEAQAVRNGTSGKPWLKAEMCKACSKSHGMEKCAKTDLVASDGSKKSVGVNGKLPPKGADGDLGPGMSGPDPKKIPSPGSGGTKKAEPPMAKPPSGKAPGTMTPVAPSGSPKVAGAPGGMQKAAMPANPKAQMAQHAQVSGSKAAAAPAPAAGAGKAPMPSPTQQAGRAQAFQSAAAGAFQPKGPVVSGLELAPKKPAGMMAPPGAMRSPTGPGPAQKSAFGKNEKCVFCKRSEHPGDCAP